MKCLKICSWVIGFVAATIAIITAGGPFLDRICVITNRGCPDFTVHGFVDTRYEKVKQIFEEQLSQGHELGSSFCVYENGKKVVDIWGGRKDIEGRPWERNTVVKVFSSTKSIVALAINMLVDRGLLKYEEKISTYWPEFSGDERENITVAQLLAHRAFYYPHYLAETWDELKNPEILSQKLATSPLEFTRGKVGYQCIHRDYYLQEIIKRVDPLRRDAAAFIEQEIVAALKDEDLQIYLKLNPEVDKVRASLVRPSLVQFLSRLLPLVYLPESLLQLMGIEPTKEKKLFLTAGDPNSYIAKACNAIFPPNNFSEDPNEHAYDIFPPSTGAFTNARTLAKIAAVLANGGELNGVKYLSRNTLKAAEESYPEAYDEVLCLNVTHTKGGWGVFDRNGIKYVGWVGYGGSAMQWSSENNIAAGYAPNGISAMFHDPRAKRLFDAVGDIVKNKK